MTAVEVYYHALESASASLCLLRADEPSDKVAIDAANALFTWSRERLSAVIDEDIRQAFKAVDLLAHEKVRQG